MINNLKFQKFCEGNLCTEAIIKLIYDANIFQALTDPCKRDDYYILFEARAQKNKGKRVGATLN